MKSVNPSEQAMALWANEIVDSKPIVMVNLLRFRSFAGYEEAGSKEADDKATNLNAKVRPPVSGQQAYARYSKAVIPLLWEVGGQILWHGQARFTFIAPEAESWDEVALVYYPNRQAFLRMVTSSAYQKVLPHRTAALADSRLIETQVKPLPKRLLSLARGVVRLKTWVSPRIL